MTPAINTPVPELLRNSAILIMGPQTINGLECLTSKIDGCWVWSPTKPKTVKPEALQRMARFELKPSDIVLRPSVEAKAKSRTKVKPSGKTSARRTVEKTKPPQVSRAFDWSDFEQMANRGSIPPVPKLHSYHPHMKKVHSMAVRKDAAGIREFSKQFVDRKGGRANLFRYIELCQKAISVRKAKPQ